VKWGSSQSDGVSYSRLTQEIQAFDLIELSVCIGLVHKGDMTYDYAEIPADHLAVRAQPTGGITGAVSIMSRRSLKDTSRALTFS